MAEQFSGDVDFLSGSKVRARIDVSHGNMMLGGNGADGDLALFRSSATRLENPDDVNQVDEYSDLKWDFAATIWLNGQDGNIMLGGNGTDGDIALFPKGVRISQSSFADATIVLDADAGDIIMRNADCAEEFDVCGADPVAPGTVMVLNEEGAVRPSDRPYDTRVAGVVSGAGTLSPAMILDRRPHATGRQPIALMGKTYCYVEAESQPVVAGDLLTTSAVPGHAMPATDSHRALGAIMGKALRPMRRGRGLIPILVTLQ